MPTPPPANVWCCHDAQIPGNLATNIITRGVILPRATSAWGASHGVSWGDQSESSVRKTINKERVKTTKQPFTSYGKRDKMTRETRCCREKNGLSEITTVGISRKSCGVWVTTGHITRVTLHTRRWDGGWSAEHRRAIFTRVLTSLNYSLQILVRLGQGQPGLRGRHETGG